MVNNKLFFRGDPEWKARRRQFITATDMASLFGLNKYSSPAKVLDSKFNPTFSDNAFTRMGRILEPAVGEAVLDSINTEVKFFAERAGNRIYYDESTRIAATPDGYIGESIEKIDKIVELKSTSHSNIKKWYKDPPLHYLTQLATQCYLIGVGSGLLAILSPVYPTLPVLILELSLTQSMVDLMISEVKRFWDSVNDSGKTTFRVSTVSKRSMTEQLISNVKIVFDHEVQDPPPEFTSINWDD